MIEIWKQYQNHYEVSNLGNVRTVGRWVEQFGGKRFFKPKSVAITDNGKGYKLFSTVPDKKKRKNCYLHRAVAELFVPNPYNLPEVNHEDGDKSNNAAYNLKWVTMLDNKKHARDNDLLVHGEDSHHSRLTKNQVLEILSAHKANPRINRAELGRIYGVVDTAICRIISGKRWTRVYNEFHRS
jgi:hypothetical protein